MTREEALETLIDNAENGYVDIEEVKLVFAELEQKPCEDAISRQAVLEYIEGSEAELGHSTENYLVCQYIKELPPVILCHTDAESEE